ncbi:DNA-binding protein [Pseudorhodoferax aquiterrae]|uniref:Ribonuclease VapC n=1 Tax=Pseudorhodoferax aquiterrae TaxID=747304 RepID=A0ABQ3GDF6_9BURK|nr:type II toxin-antitoxin system VapC family toxin [Pseudorhodoferax aquiterrae]GHD01381.1 DNA-binding protein [Pseudorhodoferax aquiterrae]
MRAVDTNVLVRAFVRDDPAQAARAQALLRAQQVFVPVTVVLELEWVLRSRYGFARDVIAAALTMIASLENAVIGERDAVLAATAHLAQGWDFADALHHALSAGCDGFATFDNALVKRAGRLPDASPAVVPV